jgi:small subunit ribosomal protein S3
MGHKIPPLGLRVGIVEDWRSCWYARKKDFGKLLVEDQKIKRFIRKHYSFAAIPKIEIERTGEQLTAVIHTARPGVLIGRKGAKIDRLVEEIQELTSSNVNPPRIIEINKPEMHALLVAENIKEQLEKRASFRRVMKRAAEQVMQAGAQGIKIQISGRLGGAEMARSERIVKGSIPLATIRAKIDYGFIEAFTTYGQLGIKVWIYTGEYPHMKEEEPVHGDDAQTHQAPQGAAAQGKG